MIKERIVQLEIKPKKTRATKCRDCGVKKKDDPSVRKTPCPYASEINDDYTETVLCDNCYYERVMDI